MKLVLYTVATAKESWSDEATRVYSKKISHFNAFEIQNIKPKKASRDDADHKKKLESEALLSALTTDDYVILFDERGKAFSSIQFAKKIEQVLNSSKKRGVFIIGGAYGVSEEVRQTAQEVISLSPLVMNHLLAQAVVLEQIYRAFTIIKKLPYHNS